MLLCGLHESRFLHILYFFSYNSAYLIFIIYTPFHQFYYQFYVIVTLCLFCSQLEQLSQIQIPPGIHEVFLGFTLIESRKSLHHIFPNSLGSHRPMPRVEVKKYGAYIVEFSFLKTALLETLHISWRWRFPLTVSVNQPGMQRRRKAEQIAEHWQEMRRPSLFAFFRVKSKSHCFQTCLQILRHKTCPFQNLTVLHCWSDKTRNLIRVHLRPLVSCDFLLFPNIVQRKHNLHQQSDWLFLARPSPHIPFFPPQFFTPFLPSFTCRLLSNCLTFPSFNVVAGKCRCFCVIKSTFCSQRGQISLRSLCSDLGVGAERVCLDCSCSFFNILR